MFGFIIVILVVLALILWDSLICPLLFYLFYPSSNQYLHSRVVLITGAAKGIGYNLAKSFLKQGCHVILWDIDGDALRKAKRHLEAILKDKTIINTTSHANLPRITAQVVDITNANMVRKTSSKLKKNGYNISILINNAGIVKGKSITQLTSKDVTMTFNVNVISQFHTLSTILPTMLDRNDGLIITISSVMGIMGGAHLTDYCASKWSLLGMDESLRMELRRMGSIGVRTLLVCPYMVNTGMFHGAFTNNTKTINTNGDSSSGGERRKNTCHLLRSAVNVLRDTLVPTLTPEQVANEVVVEAGRSFITRFSCIKFGSYGNRLILPKRLSLVPIFLRMLPVGLQELILDLSGGTLGMEGFKGKQ
jgi:all-trans-retinol dehydrogenase (NAD+)